MLSMVPMIPREKNPRYAMLHAAPISYRRLLRWRAAFTASEDFDAQVRCEFSEKFRSPNAIAPHTADRSYAVKAMTLAIAIVPV